MDCYTLFNEIGLNKDGIKIQLIFVNCLSKHKLICNFIALVLACIFVPFLGSSQVISVDPVFPTVNDTVVILFDASQGNAALKNFNGPVYVHTGLITDQSVNSTDWKFVQGAWATNDPRLLMQSLGNNRYQIRLHIKSFYKIPDGEKVNKLAFVFRNVSGSIVGRDASGADIYYNLSKVDSGFESILINPDVPFLLVQKNDLIPIQIACSKNAEIKIFQNDILLVDSLNINKLNFNITAQSNGQYDIRIECNSGTETRIHQFRFIVDVNTTIEDPPTGTQPGITFLTENSIRLALVAPFKNSVFVLGDFNNFLMDQKYLMKRNIKGDLYWIDILPVKPGFDHMIQYLIDGHIRIADPLSTLVLDPNNDSGIDSTIYPSIPKYPYGKTTGFVSVLNSTSSNFNWIHNDFKRPANEQLFVYELLIRDFDHKHTFNAITERLLYLKELGVNAIELMPVNEFEGNQSWGYNPSFHMALDKYYGSKQSFKTMIDSAHSLGIAVVLDVVFNHAFGQSPLATMYWDKINNAPASNSPYLNSIAKHPYNVGYDFNHESIYTQNYVKQVLKYWIEEFKIDGFRFDLSKGFTQKNSGSNVDLWGQYDASRINILKNYADLIWSIDNKAYVILEHFAANQEEKELADYGMMLWGNANYVFNQATMGYDQNDLNSSLYTSRGWKNNHLISYMESHDEERLMYKNLQYGNGSGQYQIKELNTALKRQMLANAFYISIPGPKMIWQFGELGYDYSINYCTNGSVNTNCRLDPKPIVWEYTTIENRLDIYKLIQLINQFKSKSQIVNRAKFTAQIGEGLLKRLQYTSDSLNVNLIGNFDVSANTGIGMFQHTGIWYDLVTGDSVKITDKNVQLKFEPGQFKYFIDDRNFISVETHPQEEQIGIFPNPVTNYIYINTNTPISKLFLYDLQGKMLCSKDNSEIFDHRIQLNHSYPSGIYFIRILMVDHKIISKKLIFN
jgi:hypothetical protein